mgnify:FL=1
MIIIENATKKFGTLTVLNNVSLTLEDGKIYGFVGQNGCGKTVLFKSICGFIYLDRGTITVDGKVIGKDIDIIKDAGIIIESPGFLPNYSAFKNLKFLTMIKDNIGDEQIKSTLISVGLDPESKKVVGKFSLGMRQRLGIAQAIMENPHILILDEPMNGLDKRGVEDIRKILMDLKKKGKLILLASHNPLDIDILCDCVYELDAGTIVNQRSILPR